MPICLRSVIEQSYHKQDKQDICDKRTDTENVSSCRERNEETSSGFSIRDHSLESYRTASVGWRPPISQVVSRRISRTSVRGRKQTTLTCTYMGFNTAEVLALDPTRTASPGTHVAYPNALNTAPRQTACDLHRRTAGALTRYWAIHRPTDLELTH